MLRGQTVSLLHPVEEGVDAFGQPRVGWEVLEEVEDVLIAPAVSEDVESSIREGGDKVSVAFYFPKTYTRPMRGLRIQVGQRGYSIEGDPQCYPTSLTPTRWNRVVRGKEVEG